MARGHLNLDTDTILHRLTGIGGTVARDTGVCIDMRAGIATTLWFLLRETGTTASTWEVR